MVQTVRVKVLWRVLSVVFPNLKKGATITLDGVSVNPKERMRACGIVMQDVRRQLLQSRSPTKSPWGLPSQKAAVDVPEILDSLDLSEFSSSILRLFPVVSSSAS